MLPMCHHLRGRVVAGILTLLALLLFGCAERSHGEAIDQSVTTYTEILQLALDADTLQPYFRKWLGDIRYPVYILDELLSASSTKQTMERFGEPVTFIRKDVAYLPDLKAYFRVDHYSHTDTTASIQLYYSVGELVLNASYRKTATGWEPIEIDLHEHERVSLETRLVIYEEILRLALDVEYLQPCLSLGTDGTPLPIVIADGGFACRSEQPSIMKFGHPVTFVTEDAVDSIGSTANLLVAEFSYHPRTDDLRSADIADIKLTNPTKDNSFDGMYVRPTTTWRSNWIQGCGVPTNNSLDSVDSIESAKDEPAFTPFPPSSIDGIDGYGYVVTGWTEDNRMHTQLVKLPQDTTSDDYIVLDSFTMRYTIRRCAEETICFVTEDDSCFYFVTIGPLPNTRRDTVVSCHKPDTGYFSFTAGFFALRDSLFSYQLHVMAEIPGEHEQCFIGRIGEDGLADTVALLVGAVGGYLSVDSTEIYVNVSSDPNHGNWPRENIGIYDLIADSLLVPLDGDYYNWGPYRVSRDEPLYFLRKTAERICNVWRWDEESGEEQLTFLHYPKDVKGYELTEDSLIYYVGSYGAFYYETEGRRVAIPIDSE